MSSSPGRVGINQRSIVSLLIRTRSEINGFYYNGLVTLETLNLAHLALDHMHDELSFRGHEPGVPENILGRLKTGIWDKVGIQEETLTPARDKVKLEPTCGDEDEETDHRTGKDRRDLPFKPIAPVYHLFSIVSDKEIADRYLSLKESTQGDVAGTSKDAEEGSKAPEEQKTYSDFSHGSMWPDMLARMVKAKGIDLGNYGPGREKGDPSRRLSDATPEEEAYIEELISVLEANLDKAVNLARAAEDEGKHSEGGGEIPVGEGQDKAPKEGVGNEKTTGGPGAEADLVSGEGGAENRRDDGPPDDGEEHDDGNVVAGPDDGDGGDEGTEGEGVRHADRNVSKKKKKTKRMTSKGGKKLSKTSVPKGSSRSVSSTDEGEGGRPGASASGGDVDLDEEDYEDSDTEEYVAKVLAFKAVSPFNLLKKKAQSVRDFVSLLINEEVNSLALAFNLRSAPVDFNGVDGANPDLTRIKTDWYLERNAKVVNPTSARAVHHPTPSFVLKPVFPDPEKVVPHTTPWRGADLDNLPAEYLRFFQVGEETLEAIRITNDSRTEEFYIPLDFAKEVLASFVRFIRGKCEYYQKNKKWPAQNAKSKEAEAWGHTFNHVMNCVFPGAVSDAVLNTFYTHERLFNCIDKDFVNIRMSVCSNDICPTFYKRAIEVVGENAAEDLQKILKDLNKFDAEKPIDWDEKIKRWLRTYRDKKLRDFAEECWKRKLAAIERKKQRKLTKEEKKSSMIMAHRKWYNTVFRERDTMFKDDFAVNEGYLAIAGRTRRRAVDVRKAERYKEKRAASSLEEEEEDVEEEDDVGEEWEEDDSDEEESDDDGEEDDDDGEEDDDDGEEDDDESPDDSSAGKRRLRSQDKGRGQKNVRPKMSKADEDRILRNIVFEQWMAEQREREEKRRKQQESAKKGGEKRKPPQDRDDGAGGSGSGPSGIGKKSRKK